LLAGKVDVSLIRVEEALSLSKLQGDKVHTILGFSELKKLVPVQPHGVLATTEAYEKSHWEELQRLTRGIIRASRALHDDFGAFERVFRHYVKIVEVQDEDVRMIWQREHDSGGFAVNGEMTWAHWQTQMELYAKLISRASSCEPRRVAFREFCRESIEVFRDTSCRF
jgi:ABC-type nitrate/sulfonate/bicarbonate transport system substrate-binding protein